MPLQNKQEGIVLERSARLNLNPGRGDGVDGGDAIYCISQGDPAINIRVFL